MTAVKRKQKVSLSLDADLIQELKAGGPLSPQVNEAIRVRLGRPAPDPAPARPSAPEGSGPTGSAEPTAPATAPPEEPAPPATPEATGPASAGADD